jgi:nicotinamide riboside transporter PnuC
MARYRQTQDVEAPIGQFALWTGMLGATFAWALHLVYSYSLVPAACAAGMSGFMYLGIPLFFGLALGCGYFAWRGWELSKELPPVDDPRHEMLKRVRFMALSGLVMTAFFAMVILAQSVPIIVQDPCEAAGSIRI